MTKNSKKNVILLMFVIFAFFIFHSSHAELFSKENAGTTGAQFLKLGGGARGVALGEAYSAVADEASAVYWNPAGLGRIKNIQIVGMHTFGLESINYEFLAYTQPISVGTLGIGLHYLSMLPIEKLNVYGEQDGSFRPYDVAINLAYGIRISSEWNAGINTKYILQEIDSVTAHGFAVDLGVLGRIWDDKLGIGLSLQNLGPEIKFIEAAYPLPLNIRLGLSYKITDSLLMALEGGFPIDNDPSLHVGCEYVFAVMKKVSLACRLGYKTTTLADINALSGLSSGVGFDFLGMKLDYTWVPYGDLGDMHHISLGIDL
ncbi:PorV/PorQ family protein [bacterium]|nr:PorV/PorQ family protein [bacterium]